MKNRDKSSLMMNFVKMHGLGNDFVILDQRSGRKVLDKAFITKVSDRHFGVGCDQLIVMESSDNADVFMRIYNPDGSEAESCGNATRCVAHILMQETPHGSSCMIETRGGLLTCRAVGDLIEVDMGPVSEVSLFEKEEWPPGLGKPMAVDVGNPHCVFFVPDVEGIPIEAMGPGVERHPAFPHRTNVEFAQIVGTNKIRLRVWERGAGLTLACGSGACATMYAAAKAGHTGSKAEIIMDGGALQMEWRESDGHVLMTGPVAYVFEGKFSL